RPARQSRRVAFLAALWLAVILVLGIWWASIVLEQSKDIATLQQEIGVSRAQAMAELRRTERMLFWESGTFLVLLLTLSGMLFRYYRRDMQRARGTQA